MRIPVKLFLVGALAVLLGAIAVYFYPGVEDATRAPVPEPAVSQSPGNGEKEKNGTVQAPAPDSNSIPAEQMQIAVDPERGDIVAENIEEAGHAIDPVRLAQAELELVNNQIYEDVARDTLPSLSIQTHNPVWVLEQEAAGEGSTSGDGEDQSGPLPAPEAGEFGMIQPPEGEIWIRIPVDYASEHRDVMAQYADLYRTETGYDGSVTILLWVGGRPYARQQYD